MKIRYRNFTRGGESYPWAAGVPGELVRKPKILVVWEFIQFLIALFSGFAIAFNAETWEEWAFFTIPLGFLVSALLLALEIPSYRVISSLSVVTALGSLAYQGFSNKNLAASVVVGIPLVVFLSSMYMGAKSQAYYAWCKSRASST